MNTWDFTLSDTFGSLQYLSFSVSSSFCVNEEKHLLTASCASATWRVPCECLRLLFLTLCALTPALPRLIEAGT